MNMGPWCQGAIVLSSWVFCDKKLLCKQFFLCFPMCLLKVAMTVL